jgi:hypothetical protein
MNVKISYTTEFDNIPYECWRMLDYKVHDGFEFKDKLIELYKDLDDNVSPIDTFDRIHNLRTILSRYDKCLEDINNILLGWTQMKLQQTQKNDIVKEQEQENND